MRDKLLIQCCLCCGCPAPASSSATTNATFGVCSILISNDVTDGRPELNYLAKQRAASPPVQWTSGRCRCCQRDSGRAIIGNEKWGGFHRISSGFPYGPLSPCIAGAWSDFNCLCPGVVHYCSSGRHCVADFNKSIEIYSCSSGWSTCCGMEEEGAHHENINQIHISINGQLRLCWVNFKAPLLSSIIHFVMDWILLTADH